MESLGALKNFRIPSDNKDEEAKAVGRLESEVKALQVIKDHPGILKLLDASVPDRFIVTEYHELGTLHGQLGRFKGDALGALQAFRPLVDAVCSIHEQGAIHRDIKPDNIFVAASDKLILGDFGIVFFQQGHDRLTSTYERAGSHEWMAPWAYKKARLELDKVDTTLDIFPLAKVLWSMIAGQNGFPFWEYGRPENNLESLFPDDPLMPLVNKRIFSKRIVREAEECDRSAHTLRTHLDELIEHIKTMRNYWPEGAETWPCRVCGKGTYRKPGSSHQVRASREGGGANLQTIYLNVYTCNHCGHVQLFNEG